MPRGKGLRSKSKFGGIQGDGHSGQGIPWWGKLILVVAPVTFALAVTTVKDYYDYCLGQVNHPERESWEVVELADHEVRCADYNHVINWVLSPQGKFVINGIIFTGCFFCIPIILRIYNAFKTIHLAETDLHRAATAGKLLDCLHEINTKKASILLRDKELNTPLHNAAIHGHLDVVKTFLNLEDGPECILIKNNNGWTALHLAVTTGHLEMVKALCEKGGKQLIGMKDKREQIAFLLAAYQGHLDVMKYLLEMAGPVQLKSKNDTGGSGMHYAAIGGRVKAMNLMIEWGGDELIRQKDNQDSTCMHKAAIMGHLDVVWMLMEKGGVEMLYDVEKSNTTPFHLACSAGHVDIVDYMLKATKDDCINAKDSRGWTCLIFAASEGRTEVVKLLLERGGLELLNDRDSVMISALDYAMAAKHDECVAEMKKIANNKSSGPPIPTINIFGSSSVNPPKQMHDEGAPPGTAEDLGHSSADDEQREAGMDYRNDRKED